jgi:hypothetical protein
MGSPAETEPAHARDRQRVVDLEHALGQRNAPADTTLRDLVLDQILQSACHADRLRWTTSWHFPTGRQVAPTGVSPSPPTHPDGSAHRSHSRARKRMNERRLLRRGTPRDAALRRQNGVHGPLRGHLKLGICRGRTVEGPRSSVECPRSSLFGDRNALVWLLQTREVLPQRRHGLRGEVAVEARIAPLRTLPNRPLLAHI